MARAQAPRTDESIDWNGDLAPNGAINQNVNFDGTPLDEKTGVGGVPIISSALFGFDDWGHLQLNQIGAGRSSGRFKSFEGSSFEGSSFEGSSFEGSSFEGSSFEGSSFEGSSFEGSSFEGSSFEGSSFEGSSFEGSSFEGSSFEGSSFEGSSFEGSSFEGQELDFLSAKALGRAAPHSMQASLIHDPAPDPNHQVQLTWKAPTFGQVATYQVFRLQGISITPATVTGATAVGSPTPATSAPDTTELPDGVPFIYFAKATFDEVPPISRNSNFAKITATNDAPVAHDDGGYTTPQNTVLNVSAAAGVLGNDTDDDSPMTHLHAVLATQPGHGAVVLNANGSFSYTPNAGYAGPDSFTYKANDGIWTDGLTPMSADSNPATVSITVLDGVPPIVTLGTPAPAPNAAGLNNSVVTISVSATDPSSVTAINCTDTLGGAALGPLSVPGTTRTATLTVSGDGTHNLVCTATDGATPANSGAAAGSTNTKTVKIDTTAPAGPTIDSGPSGEITTSSATFTFHGGTDAISFECQLDAGGYSACTSPKSVTGLALGPHTFYVRAKDAAGNVSGSATRAFTVVYTFTLAALKSTAQLGSAVPISFQLKDPQGNIVTTLTAAVPLIKMESVFNGPVPPAGCVASTTGTYETLYSPATGATGGSNLRLVSGSYQFNWDTTTASTAPIITGKGCYTVLITLSDGSVAKKTAAVQLK